jgi:hypothetical protein
MLPDGILSLSRSLKHFTLPYTEPVQQNPSLYKYFQKMYFNIILIAPLSGPPKLRFQYVFISPVCGTWPSVPLQSVAITTSECLRSTDYGVARNVIVF